MMSEIEEQKKKLRKKIKEKTAGLEKTYCTQADEKICSRLMTLAEYKTAETIFCYVGTDREINTAPIIEAALAAGKRVGVPKCISKGIMEVYQIQNMNDLKVGAYGILEPKSKCAHITPEEIQLGIIPCMTCSIDGIRLGYGGGYYDRYLEDTDFPRVVLCREKLTEKEIPHDIHDKKMHIVITEQEITNVKPYQNR